MGIIKEMREWEVDKRYEDFLEAENRMLNNKLFILHLIEKQFNILYEAALTGDINVINNALEQINNGEIEEAV